MTKGGSRRACGRSRRQLARACDGVEVLERRTLLAGNATLGADGTLTITGPESSELVSYGVVSNNRLGVTIGSTSFEFRLDRVSRIVASLLGGNDVLQTNTLFPVQADMGA